MISRGVGEGSIGNCFLLGSGLNGFLGNDIVGTTENLVDPERTSASFTIFQSNYSRLPGYMNAAEILGRTSPLPLCKIDTET